MDSLDGSEWDVLIAGTGIQQSLLALALSRSDKKVLHIDKNDYYGGTEAAFSLQEAESWVRKLQDGTVAGTSFANASLSKPEEDGDEATPKLSFSRAYSLALAPQLIYTDSKLLPLLVSSKTYRQLEFVAMGSWFVFDQGDASGAETVSQGTLLKIPTTREDLVFSDKSIDIRSKRAVMKVLRFLVEFEAQEEVWKPYADKSFSEFLTTHFKLPSRLHGLFHALTLSLNQPQETTTSFALPRIARHLRTTGLFGPGFNSVIPKWGGLSEIAQVACRAGAVGGAVYVLNKGLKETSSSEGKLDVQLSDDEGIKVPFVAGTEENLSHRSSSKDSVAVKDAKPVHRAISIISSALSSLSPPLAEGAPPPAGAVVVFPADSIATDSLPVYLIIHSSDTGECPQGQSVIYAATRGLSGLLDAAISRLLDLVGESPSPRSLWTLKYEQPDQAITVSSDVGGPDNTIVFPAPSSDLVFDESILERVKAAWQKIMGPDFRSEDFLVFEDRNPVGDDDDE